MTPQPANPEGSTGGPKLAKKATKKTAASKEAATKKQAAKKTPAKKQPAPEPEVRTVETSVAKRAGIYLHPDDWRALQEARLEDGADMNARIRAMIAFWRHDLEHGSGRTAERINRLARTAPRGGQGERS